MNTDHYITFPGSNPPMGATRDRCQLRYNGQWFLHLPDRPEDTFDADCEYRIRASDLPASTLSVLLAEKEKDIKTVEEANVLLANQLTFANTKRQRLREALESIKEYWNGNVTESAMLDTLRHVYEIASSAIALDAFDAQDDGPQSQVTEKVVDELLPCPFCGSSAVLQHTGEYWVTCGRVGVCYAANRIEDGRHGFTFKEDAIQLWNARSTAPLHGHVTAEMVKEAGEQYLFTETGMSSYEFIASHINAALSKQSPWRPMSTPPTEKAAEQSHIIEHGAITPDELSAASIIVARWLHEHPELTEIVIKKRLEYPPAEHTHLAPAVEPMEDDGFSAWWKRNKDSLQTLSPKAQITAAWNAAKQSTHSKP